MKGPGQVSNDINSSNVTSEAFTLTLNQFLNQSRQQGSRVTMGNLLTLPVGGGLLYVQPIYVRASGSSAYPLSRATVVAFGDKLAWSDTPDGALDGLFGGSSGATAGDSGSSPTKAGHQSRRRGRRPHQAPTRRLWRRRSRTSRPPSTTGRRPSRPATSRHTGRRRRGSTTPSGGPSRPRPRAARRPSRRVPRARATPIHQRRRRPAPRSRICSEITTTVRLGLPTRGGAAR